MCGNFVSSRILYTWNVVLLVSHRCEARVESMAARKRTNYIRRRRRRSVYSVIFLFREPLSKLSGKPIHVMERKRFTMWTQFKIHTQFRRAYAMVCVCMGISVLTLSSHHHWNAIYTVKQRRRRRRLCERRMRQT